MLRHVVWYEFIDVSEVLPTFTTRAMSEAGSTSETSVNLCQSSSVNYASYYVFGQTRTRFWLEKRERKTKEAVSELIYLDFL
jgi:hypothetical protein